jgi:RNA12 protein
MKFAVAKLGGRVADLESFFQKVMSGMTPRNAITYMENRAISQIRIDGFGFSPGKHAPVRFIIC